MDGRLSGAVRQPYLEAIAQVEQVNDCAAPSEISRRRGEPLHPIRQARDGVDGVTGPAVKVKALSAGRARSLGLALPLQSEAGIHG